MTASKVKFENGKKVQVAKVGKANWSQLENARRIAASMVRYGYCTEAEGDRLFNKLVKVIERDLETFSRAQLRGITNALGLNSDERTRNKTAKLVFKLVGK
jgi:polyhydroxyalkanoate synthesis regulator phasin